MVRPKSRPVLRILSILVLGAGLCVLVLSSARAEERAPPRFGLPVACNVGRDCFIQNYVDHDPGAGRRDYGCGRLSYDGHKGTDLRLPDYPAMEAGVAVLAAADGVVRAVRDGMEDVNIRGIGRETLGGRDAGNSVVVVHGDGWETQYAHMKRGSIAVKPGEPVRAGQTLGLIGLSGNTEFPHLHFEVRHDGKTVDPFLGPDGVPSCDQPAGMASGSMGPGGSMWRDPAAVPYIATALLSAGFAFEKPDAERARQGAYRADAIPAEAPALIVWADAMGMMAGDRIRFRMDAPDGRTLFEHESTQAKSMVSQFSFAGLRRPADGWPKGGDIRATVTLVRDGQPLSQAERRLPSR
jgi:murein DD-endopeptidase MepM/ murein hydrolase activator NlpD